MERCKNITIVILLVIGITGTVTFAKSSSTLLQEGLYAEEVDGDLNAAIRIYEQIINDGSAQRSHIAQAMYRQGMCYLKKQNEQRAKEIFGRLVANYSDQTRIVSNVKPLLEELGNADPAALMPAETLIYMETGSPGRQIETILNMLKGTPLENPLAMLGGGAQVHRPAGGMVSALMNPAMMAEFKKIRGMGVGVTGIALNNPPVVVVLFPGKSDALRGLILAGLGMIGTPGEPIEGMQSIVFNDGGGAAYDETTVIIASPKAYSMGQLTWSVKQYKGVTSEPTLASSNKSFAKISRKARQENTLTMWTNFDELFAGLSEILPEEHFPKEIHLADEVADFKNIDDLIVFFNLKENGIALESNIAFKDGHNCIAYNMIRTPNLSRAGFEAVPSEAIGLVSIALGEAGNAQSLAASKSIKSFTGLDIGREIFTNIEQINLFALPPDSSAKGSNTGVLPIAANLGLTVTSRNPQRTREILTQLLTVANLVTGQADVGQPVDGTGQYQIGLINNQKLYCYMNQMNKTTVISLNPDVVDTSVSAIKRRRSVCTAGLLNEAVSKLSPSTSKLVLVNVGGGIRVADAFLKATYNNPQNPVHKTILQLAQALEKTSIQLGTDERVNNFNVRLSIDQLPPLDNLFPVLMHLSQTDLTAKAIATKPQPRDGITIGISTVSELKWRPGINAKSHKIYFGTNADQLPLLAEVKSSSYGELPALEEDSKYYWRVDEVWADGTLITGDVWDFTIGNIVGWWKFDGDANDSSSKGNKGTEIGDPTYVAGKIGQAISFDGEGDRIEIPATVAGNPELFPTRAISTSAWVRTTVSANGLYSLVRHEFHFTPLQAFAGGAHAVAFTDQNGSRALRQTSFDWSKINDGKWHHCVVTYNNGIHEVWIDSTKEVSNNFGPFSLWTGDDQPWVFGGKERGEGGGEHYPGELDDVHIYNYALSEGEITALYNEGK